MVMPGGRPEAELGVIRSKTGDSGDDGDPGGGGWKGLVFGALAIAVVVALLVIFS